MYQPKKYKKKDKSYITSFIDEHPFSTFILKGKTLMATHIPILNEGSENILKLTGHIANHNSMKDYLENDMEVMLIFKGPDAYVSSSWYEEKDISTWDYSAVHVQARLYLQTDFELENSLKNLIHTFEKKQENPLFYEDIPKQIINNNFQHITGFYCIPYEIEAIAKLHQGFSTKDINNISKQLKNSNCPHEIEVANAIKKQHEKDN